MSTEEKTGNIIEQVTETVSVVTETVSVVTEKISDVKDNLFDEEIIAEYKQMGSDAASKIISQLNDSKDILSKSGYLLSNLSVNIGIPPQIKILFKFSKEIPVNERENLIEESKGKTIVTLVLKSLFSANDLFGKVKVGGFKLISVQIAIGLIPDVTINLSSE